MAASSTVSSGDTILATQYNNLRQDAIHATLSHGHTGAASDGKLIADLTPTGGIAYFNTSTGHDHDGTNSKKFDILQSGISNKVSFHVTLSDLTATISGTGSLGVSADRSRYITGTTAGNSTYTDDLFSASFLINNGFTSIFNCLVNLIVAQDAFWGFDNGNFTDVPTNSTSVEKHIGFFIEDATLYASNANGTTQTKTDISSGITLTTFNNYFIDFTAATNIKFYVNGTLKATHTTNLPVDASNQWELFVGIMTQDTSQHRLEVTTPVWYRDKTLG